MSAMSFSFSAVHSFTEAQIHDAATAVADEGGAKRLLLGVSSGYRGLAYRQFIAVQIASLVSVMGLYLAERDGSTIASDTLGMWLGVSILNLLARTCVCIPLYVLPPATVAKSIVLRCTPLFITAVAIGYWAWTIDVFIGHQTSLSTFLLCLGLISISVAMIGMSSATPVATITYLASVWGVLLVKLHRESSVDISSLVILIVQIGTILGLTYMIVTLVRKALDRSDEIDLVVAKLERIRNAAATELERRSSFFAAAQHDLRQRLHAMRLTTLTTSTGLPSADERSRRAVMRLSSEVEDLERYTRGLLDFAKFEIADAPPQLHPTSIQSVFQTVNVHFEGEAIVRNVPLTFRATPLVIFGDAQVLERIVENLVSNAIKFTRGGVLVAARQTPSGVSIEVWDQGPGIGLEVRGQIFEQFNQGDRVRLHTGASVGVGLGLAIVKRCSAWLGYRVNLESRVGKGSVFRILIPANLVVQGHVDPTDAI